jgi:hypothetical protein
VGAVKLPTIPRLSDHGSEIVLLGLIALGVMVLMGLNARWAASAKLAFDPSAYLVVLTLIVGAIKERWTQRSVDRMGASLANAPPSDPPAIQPDQEKK